jgi:hypothetical protein
MPSVSMLSSGLRTTRGRPQVGLAVHCWVGFAKFRASGELH